MATANTNKPWTLRDIEAQDPKEGIYVRNNAPMNSRAFRERILVVVPKDGMDGSDLVRVPGTDIPWELTSQVTRSSLLRSSDFRNAIRRNILVPVSPTEAEEILARPNIIKDVAAIIQSEEAHSMEDINSSLDASDVLPMVSNQVGVTLPQQTASVNAPPGVNETVYAIMETAGTQTEGMVITSIRGILNKTVADYRYILSKARDLEFSDLEERAAKKIKAMEEATEDDV